MLYVAIFGGMLAFALFGAWIAGQKGRSPIEGAIVGLIFGPIGVLVEVGLPTEDYQASAPVGRETARRPLTKEELAEMEEDRKAKDALNWLSGS